MAYPLFSRERLLTEAQNVEKWDVIIIGGGASGLGIALDSATRGFKTLLLEQTDFAKGTSSRSTKLVHGGIRYLAQGNIELVKEALHERGLLAKNAPHLVKKQIFVIPNYQWWESIYYNVGLKTYDFLAGKLSMGKSERISREDVIHRFDTLVQEDLKGGIVYLDGQFDDSRLAVNIAQTCIENGAVALNHFKVTGMLKNQDGNLSGVEAEDGETGETYSFNTDVIINATGVFADYLRKLANPEAKPMIRASQGIHLVFDKKFFPGKDALMIPRTDDGRVLFAVPWKNKVLVGTTDTLLEKPQIEPRALDKEIEFILETFNHYIQHKVTREDVQSVFAGLRPLAGSEDEDKSTKEISRGHKIMLGDNGMISIIGGKWTTYRKMAEDTIDFAIAHQMLEPEKCITEDFLIHGAKSLISREDHLSIYGSDLSLMKNLILEKPELAEKLHDRIPNIKAEVVWAVHYEMARTLEDVLARRLRVLFLDSEAAVEIAPEVAKIIAEELKKDSGWIEDQIAEFTKLAQNYRIESFQLNSQ